MVSVAVTAVRSSCVTAAYRSGCEASKCRPQHFVRMTSLNWKGSKISLISDFASRVIHLSDFKMWRNNAVRNVKAAGGTWITRLFDKIKMENNKIPRLCDQSKDNYRQILQGQPSSNRCKREEELQQCENDIQSFGAQISKVALKEKQDIFNQTEMMEFPLCPILEWHSLYHSYDPHLDTDPTTYWNALNNVMAEKLDMGVGKIVRPPVSQAREISKTSDF
eukprot:3535724-Rhodomonas_salina.1